MLPAFGLRTMENLQSEIHRYQYSDIKKVVMDIKSDMQGEDGNNNLYTISLVKNNQLHKLPNVNITNLQELKAFYEKYSLVKDYSEIWLCKKKGNKEQNFSVGRISFETRDQRDSVDYQTIEQVWNVSHRNIEGYTNQYKEAYIRASRIAWGMRYSVEELKIPKDNNLDKEKMILQFTEVVKEIERRREKIENFENYLKTLEINQFSLEYLLQKGKFLFIDWDSQDDLKAIEKIPQEQCEFSDYGIDKFIEFINQSNNGYLLVIGGGEPFKKYEQILKIVQQVKTDRLILVTNGMWAQNYEEAKKVIFELYTNFKNMKDNFAFFSIK